MNRDHRFVCAFPGRRDGYQVPLALAEQDRLGQFLTDFYWSGPAAFWGERLLAGRRLEAARQRRQPDLPATRVRVLWASSLRRVLETRRGLPLTLRYAREGIRFAEAARDAARRRDADLFLYPPCSHEAFTAAYPRRQPRRVLFQFHPHPGYQERLLRADLAQHPEVAQSFHEEAGDELPEPLKRRDWDAWRHADLLLCASRFTRDTLLAAGADPLRCRIVPYGVDDPAGTSAEVGGGNVPPPRPGFHALFVGTGSQRKGLHHLLAAWNAATLPAESSLTIVCRHVDPGLQPALAASQRTVLLSSGVSAAELQRLYQTSTLLVMPSLIEGFGAVFLEAMRHGCPVLGTAHTCLPDLGTESEGVFLTSVGDPAALAARLQTLAAVLPDRPSIRQAARACSAQFTWTRFRRGIIQALDETVTLAPAD